MDERGSWKPYNGRSSSISRIIEALVVAAIVGGLSVWGNSRVVDARLEMICASVNKLETAAEYLKSVTGTLQTKDSVQDVRIDALERRMIKRDGH